jgi:hypothetical protein
MPRRSIKPSRTVREDWFAPLPAEKHRLFEAAEDELEVSYRMLSVALDEAFARRGEGLLAHAQLHAGASADFFDRLAAHLLATLRALEDHGRHFGTLPNVTVLNPEFFRGETAQHTARKSSLLQKVLLSGRSKFFHKLRALAETVEDLKKEFSHAAQEIQVTQESRPSFFREISESPRTKLIIAWATVGALVIPLAALLALGVSEKTAIFLLLSSILPFQYGVFRFWRKLRLGRTEAVDRVFSRSPWNTLEILHYDLNTCLRETIVVLKSFLLALPNEELEEFKQRLGGIVQPEPEQSSPRLPQNRPSSRTWRVPWLPWLTSEDIVRRRKAS